MRIIDSVNWTIKKIKIHLVESMLIILGIGLGVAVIANVVSIVQYNTQNTEDMMTSTHYRNFTIVKAENSYISGSQNRPLTPIGRAEEVNRELTYQDYIKIKEENIEGLKAIWIVQQSGEIAPDAGPRPRTKDNQEMQKWHQANMLEILQVTPDVFEIMDFELTSGNLFTFSDLNNRNKVIVIGADLAKEYFPDQNSVGKKIKLSQGSFQVIGTIKMNIEQEEKRRKYIHGLGSKEELNRKIFVPYFSYQPQFQRDNYNENEVRQIYLQAEKDIEPGKFFEQINSYVEQHLPGMKINGSYLSSFNVKDSQLAFSKLIGLFAIIAFFITAINILNLMMARVLRRSKNIGISTALGAGKRDIITAFLMEAFLLALIGSLFGIVFAFGGIKLLNNFIFQGRLSLTLFPLMVGISSSILVSLLFGFYPSLQAASINPVDALREE